MRKAFSMITAIFLMLTMATVSVLVFNLSGKMVKSTTIQYRQEQAAFLARSYTELAILAVINHDRDNAPKECIQTIKASVNGLVPGGGTAGSTLDGAGYKVETYIRYIGNTLPCDDPYWLNKTTPLSTDYNTVITLPPKGDSIAAIVVDVYVRYKDPAVVDAFKAAHSGTAPTASETPWISYHRRSLQKI